jgi:hypothetical protein
MLEDFLTLTGSVVSIIRTTETPDGMGGVTTTTVITGLSKAAIWSPSQSRSYISNRMAETSSHILVTVPGYYTFNKYDRQITFNSEIYTINGFDDVMQLGEIMVVGLEKIV